MELTYKLDNADTVNLVQGEERSIEIRLLNKETLEPIDLTAASAEFEMLLGDGSVLKRSTNGLTFTDDNVGIADNRITISGHGLVDGDKIQLTTTGVLPDGLSLLTDYWVQVETKNTIKLLDAVDGDVVNIESASGGGVHTLTLTDAPLALSGNAVLGKLVLNLQEHVTEKMRVGNYQNAQVSYTASDVKRIVLLVRALNVADQIV